MLRARRSIMVVGWDLHSGLQLVRGDADRDHPRQLGRFIDHLAHRRKVYFPRISSEPKVTLLVHAKVMVIDDNFLRVGSSNLSNRSLGLDSECDMAIAAAPSSPEARAIAAFRERRGLLDLRLAVRGHRLALLATHLGLGPAERRHQVRRILAHLDTITADTFVVLGDFNEWLHWGRPLRALNLRLGPSPRLPSFPATCPLVAIDRLWIHPAHRLQSCRVHVAAPARIASDHLPLVADIDLSTPSDTG